MTKPPIVPPPVGSGGCLGLVTVAAPEPYDFPDRTTMGIEKLQQLGYRTVSAPNMAASSGISAADPEEIAEDLMTFWMDDSIDAILCTGGGITCNMILPYLLLEAMVENPKTIVGASNPTVLLNALAAAGLTTFHGPSLIWDFGDPAQPVSTVASFQAVVSERSTGSLGSVPEFLVEGVAEGILLGGNLTSLMHLVGTPWMPKLDGAVLLWEDIGEDAAHLAANLTHLLHSGQADRLAAIVVGELVDCGPTGKVGVPGDGPRPPWRLGDPDSLGTAVRTHADQADPPDRRNRVIGQHEWGSEMADLTLRAGSEMSVCRAIVICESLLSRPPVLELSQCTARYLHNLDRIEQVWLEEHELRREDRWGVAGEIASVLRSPGWYAHLHCGDTLIVAYPSIVVEVRRGDAASAELCRRIGTLFDVPAEQMRFEEMFQVDHPDKIST